MPEQDRSGLPPSFAHAYKLKSTSSPDGNKDEKEESISDGDLDNIVGVTDSTELEVRETQQLLVFMVAFLFCTNFNLGLFRKWNLPVLYYVTFALIRSKPLIG